MCGLSGLVPGPRRPRLPPGDMPVVSSLPMALGAGSDRAGYRPDRSIGPCEVEGQGRARWHRTRSVSTNALSIAASRIQTGFCSVTLLKGPEVSVHGTCRSRRRTDQVRPRLRPPATRIRDPFPCSPLKDADHRRGRPPRRCRCAAGGVRMITDDEMRDLSDSCPHVAARKCN